MTENHNPIFEKLEADSDDLESLVAYALYKQHKRKWALEFEQREGRKPDQTDDAAFANAVGTEDQLNRYRQNAADLMISFANQVVEDSREEIAYEAITTRIESAASAITGTASVGKQIGSGIISTLVTTFVLIVLTIAAALFGVDPLDGISTLTSSIAEQSAESDVQEPQN